MTVGSTLTSEVKNLTGGAVHDCHVKLFIAFEPYFLSEILNLGGLTSTVEQVAGLANQIVKLKEAGCTSQTIFQEQVSSVKMSDRVEFVKVLGALRVNDVIVFSSLSRAARSMVHMIEIEATVARAGATIRILDLAIDTATSSGRLTFNLFASIAQFERENMLERQKVGIAAAKERGAYTGRAPTARAKGTKVQSLHAKGLTKQEIADACSIGVASVYRILKARA